MTTLTVAMCGLFAVVVAVVIWAAIAQLDAIHKESDRFFRETLDTLPESGREEMTECRLHKVGGCCELAHDLRLLVEPRGTFIGVRRIGTHGAVLLFELGGVYRKVDAHVEIQGSRREVDDAIFRELRSKFWRSAGAHVRVRNRTESEGPC